MRLNKRFKRTLKIEKLDDRSMLAGNVTAAVVGSTLQLTGDSKDNSIIVTQVEGGWKVTGLPSIDLKATKINNQSKPQIFSDFSSICIITGNGNDGVAVVNGFLPGTLSVDTGANKDLVVLTNLQVGGVNVSTGGDIDALLAINVQVSDEESPSIHPNGGPVGFGTANFDTGDATDFVLLAGVRAPNLNLTTGKGNDYVGLLGVNVDNALCVDVGAGTDMLAVVKTTANAAKFKNGNSAGEQLFTAANSFGSLSSDFKSVTKLDSLLASLSKSMAALPSSIASITGNPALNNLGLSSLINNIV